VLACATTTIAAPNALAQIKMREVLRTGVVSDATQRPGVKTPSPFGLKQHGSPISHLPAAKENMELIGELNLRSPSTGQPVAEGQIADVAVHKGFAYLNSWDSPICRDGGTFVVDIRNPAAPRQVAFIPAPPNFYHGEGAHVLSVSTPQFTGDILAVNDETYGSNLALTVPCAPASKQGGGFDLYNVTNPTNPVPLVQGAGDRSPEGSTVQNPALVGKSYHSVFMWQDGPRAYLVASDNTELADVDIFDITNPRNPEFINDLDLLTLPQANEIVDELAQGNTVLHHDVVVKKIGSQVRMLVSYWDAGYVQLNVNDPRNATFITDTDFDDPDPLTGLDPPQGNAHQAEYSADSQFFLGADEEFAPYRLVSRITQAPYLNQSFSAALSAAEPIDPGTQIAGDTIYVGDACAALPAATAAATIAVAERGTCDFQTKANNIQTAGYALGVIFNNSFGAGGRCESLLNMLIDPATTDIPMVFVGRQTALRILNVFNAATYKCTGAATPTAGDTPAPPVGTNGLTIAIGSEFDGWGYTHLYDANTSEEIDAYAIPEALDPRYANNFGDLSVHEFATDPTTNLAYASWYAGGMRVFRFSRAGGLEPVGKYIDERGSNFWGVEAFTDAAGNRLIAGSDRDFGLQIFKYTGPGAVLAKPAPTPTPPVVTPPAPPATPATPVVTPSSFFGFGPLQRVTIRNRRARVTIVVPGSGRATASPKARIGKRMVVLDTASATATRAGSMRFTFTLTASMEQRLRRSLARRPTRRTSGVVRVSFTRTGGVQRTRNKAISIMIGR